ALRTPGFRVAVSANPLSSNCRNRFSLTPRLPAGAAIRSRLAAICSNRSCNFFFFSSRRRHTRSVSAFLLNRSSDLSVTEKLMDELAQCYNVLPQLDINDTIDHRPEGDEKWFLENEKTVTQFCRKLAAERPLKDIRDEYNYPKKKGIKDECSRL